MTATNDDTRIIIETPSTEEISRKNALVVASAEALVVNDPNTHGDACSFLKQIAAGQRSVKEFFADMKTKAHEAHKSICTSEKELLEPLTEARRMVDGKIGTYETDQRRIAAETQRRLQAEQQRIEDARLAREREEQEIIQRQLAEKEEERRLAAAQEAQDRGDAAAAEAILDAPTPEPAPALAPAPPAPPPVVHVEPAFKKPSGMASVTTWSAECFDLHLLVAHVAQHRELVYLLEPSSKGLNSLARSLKREMSIPGVRAVSQTKRSVRA